jgi:hypothetical protein
MSIATGGAVAISEVLSQPWRLVIPDYQRDYAWDRGDCLQLVADMREEMAGEPGGQAAKAFSYYLGTIVLALPGDTEDGADAMPPAEIVDGQQRLATITMLLACLRDRQDDRDLRTALDRLIALPLASAASGPEFVLTLRGHDGDFLRKYVQAQDATRLTPLKRLAKRNIVDVRETLCQIVDSLASSERNALAAFLTRRCTVAVVTTSSREQAWRIFGRLNQRGKRLRVADILRSVIIGGIAPDDRARYVRLWERHKAELGSHFEGEAIGRRYLFNYIAELGGRSGNILDSVIAQVQGLGAKGFMDTVFAPVAEALSAVVRQDFGGGTEAQRAQVNTYLKFLEWADDSEGTAAAILLLRHFGGRPADLVAQLAALDRYVHGRLLLKRSQYKLGFRKNDRLKAALAALSKKGSDTDLRTMLRWSPMEARLVRLSLEYGLAGRIAKIVLARLLLAGGGASLKQCDDIVQSKKWDVEHLVPVSPQANNDWQEVLGPGKSVGQYAKKLGNLYLVQSWLNDLLDNRSWSHKSAVLAQHPDAPMLPQDDGLKAPGWCSAKIDARHGALMRTAIELWQVAPSKTAGPQPVPAPKKKRRRRKRQR